MRVTLVDTMRWGWDSIVTGPSAVSTVRGHSPVDSAADDAALPVSEVSSSDEHAVAASPSVSAPTAATSRTPNRRRIRDVDKGFSYRVNVTKPPSG